MKASCSVLCLVPPSDELKLGCVRLDLRWLMLLSMLEFFFFFLPLRRLAILDTVFYFWRRCIWREIAVDLDDGAKQQRSKVAASGAKTVSAWVGMYW